MKTDVRRDIALALRDDAAPDCLDCSVGSEWNICRAHLDIYLKKADVVLAVMPTRVEWGSGPDQFHILKTTEWHARDSGKKVWRRLVRTITDEWKVRP